MYHGSFQGRSYKTMAMIGDGATDLEVSFLLKENLHLTKISQLTKLFTCRHVNLVALTCSYAMLEFSFVKLLQHKQTGLSSILNLS